MLRINIRKGGKARTVGLDPEAMGVLERWLDRRETLGLSRSQPVFSTRKGQGLDSSYVCFPSAEFGPNRGKNSERVLDTERR
jgi:integrase